MIKSKELLIKKIIVASIIILVVSTILLITTSKEKGKSILNEEVSEQKVQDTVAVYLQDESNDTGYSRSDTIPTEGYVFNESASYCTIDGNRDDSITLSYKTETQMLTVSPMTAPGTKCYLYFDKQVSIKDTLLTYYPTVLTRTDFSTTVTETTTGIIYKSADESQYDDDGEVYYFAGNPTDNWVSFAGFYWRIVRINGDGSVRLIYQGTSEDATGEETRIGTSAFNSSTDYSYYVGLSYDGTQHGTGLDSTILEILNEWYNKNLVSYANYIDTKAKFCSDRVSYSNTSGTTESWAANGIAFFYAPYIRLTENKNPTLLCSSSDILNIPIGLITADEAIYGGISLNGTAANNYLTTEQDYWTMTPSHFTTRYAFVYRVSSSGQLGYSNVSLTSNIRPIINLRSDVTISSGNGTASQPFVINTD